MNSAFIVIQKSEPSFHCDNFSCFEVQRRMLRGFPKQYIVSKRCKMNTEFSVYYIYNRLHACVGPVVNHIFCQSCIVVFKFIVLWFACFSLCRPIGKLLIRIAEICNTHSLIKILTLILLANASNTIT